MDNILQLFIREPEKEFHVRQISKIVKKSPTTISKYLKNLEKQGILESEKKLNHLLFKANLNNERFKQIKLNYNLVTIKESGIIEYLEKELNSPKAIILFGSFAKAENNKKSDVDILIISELKKHLSLEKFEKKIGNNIQIFIHSESEIEKIKQKNKELLNSWINGIILYGFWELFK